MTGWHSGSNARSFSTHIQPRICLTIPLKRTLTMPLLEINQTRRISATIRLDEATAAQIDQYAAFLNASADEVVDKALAYVFTKDRDFQDFLRTEGAVQVPPRLRIRHSPRPSANQGLLHRPGRRPKAVQDGNDSRPRN